MIQKWKFKALVQKTISILPFCQNLNYIFQKYVTRAIELTDLHWGNKIAHARDHISYYNNFTDKNLKEKIVLELGTGWYPIVPICLFLSNADKIITIDIKSWMTKSFQLKAIEKFIELREKGQLEKFLPNINNERWDILKDIMKRTEQNRTDCLTTADINRMLCIESMITDARQTGLASNSIDFICSNNTFEHIDKSILPDILKEFRRIIKKDGIMSHFIDMSDHFSHYDNSITNYNFLKYSERTWKMIDNNIQPQNRLRLSDYKSMYKKQNIPVSREIIIGCQPDQLNQIKVSDDFKAYSEKELAISHAYIISKFIHNEY